MVSFRRWATIMALLMVVAALASAQSQPLVCATNVSVTPTLRAEGYTEQTGDITLTCTGGVNLVAGSVIPQVNITLFYNTQVTSRLLPISGSTNNSSEALLLLDEPGSGLQSAPGIPTPGAALPQRLCTTPLTGCVEYVATATGVSFLVPNAAAGNVGIGRAADGCTTFTGAACTTTTTTAGPNVFQGIVSGNTITFFGVPILAPVSSGETRTIRITNARVNATTLGGGSAAGGVPVITSISISGAQSLLITNPTPTVGFVQGGLTGSVSGASTFNQCTSVTRSSTTTLTFAENFPTAFKTRIAAQVNASYAGQAIPGTSSSAGTLPNQNVPGSIYNSESNFVYQGAGMTGTAGLADFGTRLRAVFNNVPTGVRIFVSTVNVNNNASPIAGPTGGVIGGNNQTTPFAQLVNSETVSDGNSGTSGFFPTVASTDFGPNGGNVPVAEINVDPTSRTATAVWEVVNTNPNSNESVKFAVYTTFASNVAQNTPPATTSPGVTVNFSFAPAPPTYSASASAVASSSLAIPRFVADSAAGRTIANISICRTILLYPYVTNIQGFDTGLAIANTSTDPFSTGAQAGKCTLNWYQGTNNPAATDSGTIATGTVYTTLASVAVPGFNGYMIAVCNFQYAHGFAFVSDLGARNLAMGYLALVIPDPATNGGGRNASQSGCGATSGANGGVSCGTGEGNGH